MANHPNRSRQHKLSAQRKAARLRAYRLVQGGSPEPELLAAIDEAEPPSMTYSDAIDAILRWRGEEPGEASDWFSPRQTARQQFPSLGLALNFLAQQAWRSPAYWDLSAIALLAMTAEDVRSLRQGG